MEEAIYNQVVTNIAQEITSQYGSLLAFVKHNERENFNYENLSRLLGNKSGQRMSLETFLRLMHALDLTRESIAEGAQGHNNITLLDYLNIDNNAVFKLVFKVLQL